MAEEEELGAEPSRSTAWCDERTSQLLTVYDKSFHQATYAIVAVQLTHEYPVRDGGGYETIHVGAMTHKKRKILPFVVYIHL